MLILKTALGGGEIGKQMMSVPGGKCCNRRMADSDRRWYTHAHTHTHTHTHTKVVHRAFWEPGSRRLTNQVCSALEDPNKPVGAEALT